MRAWLGCGHPGAELCEPSIARLDGTEIRRLDVRKLCTDCRGLYEMRMLIGTMNDPEWRAASRPVSSLAGKPRLVLAAPT